MTKGAPLLRTLLTLGEAQWSRVEGVSRSKQAEQVVFEFWREALCLTDEEWDQLPRHSFSVMDYEVGRVDYDRLEAILLSRSRNLREKRSVGLVLLAWAPAMAP